jgi:hypothetical protein
VIQREHFNHRNFTQFRLTGKLKMVGKKSAKTLQAEEGE